jgi:hypothetical protein
MSLLGFGISIHWQQIKASPESDDRFSKIVNKDGSPGVMRAVLQKFLIRTSTEVQCG